ncbi:MAG: hypothetical protein GF411_19190 [Candidatus Lokiarchaeota archaeon]|nr:hypothetical protein [Candidatus Lokiarchaeota archaeon]
MTATYEDVDYRDIESLPTLLAILNLLVVIPIGYYNMTHGIGFWDILFALVGVYFAWKFIRYIIAANSNVRGRLNPNYATEIISEGIYADIRYPIGAAFIYMNIAFVFLFRAIALIPVIPFFGFLWFIMAKRHDEAMLRNFGDKYKQYMLGTGLLRGSGSTGGRLATSGYGMY